ncbi:hypothetical protein [Corynebacterium sp.]|uniref:hypothetical protein n=1 Tax=Corynebacterium sp. TaxID=1720 RepID=UPI0026DC224F|nr:hypothetical protein [Corynebacterium sp.]MDO5076666.1 hypothetical protein [Corynebacterium sp.]
MSTYTTIPETVNARKVLVPYVLGVLGSLLVIHLVIAFGGGRIGPLVQVLMVVLALGMAAWFIWQRRALARIRFGTVVAHAFSYVAVVSSFQIHALVQGVRAGANGTAMDMANLLLGTPWFGFTLQIGALWGIGLMIHIIGTILGRGWED